jgi:hypothetical protein
MLHHAVTLARRTSRLTLVLVAVLAAGAGWAVAATTTSSGVIHACAARRDGTLRLARACNKHERALSWNIQGVRGAPGRDGANGINGTNGTDGAPGTARAFGLVAPDGTLTRAKNATVSHAGVGIYCITPAPGIDPATTGVIATPDFTNDSTLSDRSSSNNTADVEFHSNRTGCPSSSLQVDTFEVNNANADGDHYDVQHNDQSFFFVIP